MCPIKGNVADNIAHPYLQKHSKVDRCVLSKASDIWRQFKAPTAHSTWRAHASPSWSMEFLGRRTIMSMQFTILHPGLETITDGALSCILNLFSNLPEKIYSRGGFLISFEDEGSGWPCIKWRKREDQLPRVKEVCGWFCWKSEHKLLKEQKGKNRGERVIGLWAGERVGASLGGKLSWNEVGGLDPVPALQMQISWQICQGF